MILKQLNPIYHHVLTVCFVFLCFLGGGGGDFGGGWRILGRSLVCAYFLYLKFLSANPKIIVSHLSIHW